MFVPDNAFYTIYPVDIKVTRIKRFLLKKKVFSKTCPLNIYSIFYLSPPNIIQSDSCTYIYIFTRVYFKY